jgi:serine/threonine protein kinase
MPSPLFSSPYWLRSDRFIPFSLSLLQGLRHLHELKLAHVDIKPANIFVREVSYGNENREEYVLGDFNTTVPFGSEVSDEGEGRYLPPEYISPWKLLATPQADVFSLGASIYELARGQTLPQSRNNDPEGYSALRAGRIPPVEGFSNTFTELIRVSTFLLLLLRFLTFTSTFVSIFPFVQLSPLEKSLLVLSHFPSRVSLSSSPMFLFL